ncbi:MULTISPECIES: hypothetical protein [Nocardia]|uniref:Uncharacterized protein n=2 Tax=Nocardia TaxID=1817 RepID=K0EXF8_NOCB7|nr:MULTISPECIES: hypothetical protein [Nocardia]AFU02167.1 hypothetical protein O3I_021040 [Nocardia brasiliensis ATCC 700358]ASF07439.1 hypothetical protein CEQ30_08765 [Nocardia brasiliensis]KIA60749.1 hypothetical protein FG87_35115 [Nocardia vulneris]MBF6129309.1 hypothetical protein [Nocardia brasiliensis]OCF87632.1 hypothetical protein AW168_24370 [Nocardia brasiliensis]
MIADHTSGFAIDDITVGPFAHGFGTTADGRPYAFRTVRATLTLEIYRADLADDMPGPDDVVAVAQARVTDIDLDDERSVVALVRDTIPAAVPTAAIPDREMTTVRALLGRISSVIDGM